MIWIEAVLLPPPFGPNPSVLGPPEFPHQPITVASGTSGIVITA